MILVTGAAGKTGRAVIAALQKREETVRALVHREACVENVRGQGAAEVVVGDLRDPYLMPRIMEGMRAVYHICPNVLAEELSVGHQLIQAAQSAGLEHFVFHSVLHPQVEAMPHHWNKMRVEELLFTSGLAYTILQPATYMQNLLGQWQQITQKGIYSVPYDVDSRLVMVDLKDVAEVAARVLTESGHTAATYELVGPQALTQVEVADILSQELGQPVRAARQSLDTWRRNATSAGLGSYQIDTLVKMFTYYDQYGFNGNSHVLNWLLGRPATAFSAFIRREIDKQAGAS